MVAAVTIIVFAIVKELPLREMISLLPAACPLDRLELPTGVLDRPEVGAVVVVEVIVVEADIVARHG